MNDPYSYRLLGWKKDDPYWRREKSLESIIELIQEVAEHEGNLQRVHTPFPLCNQILDRLEQEIRLKDCDCIAVLFNLEFVPCLVERGVNPRRIWFFADSPLKRKRAEEWYNVHAVDIRYDNTKKNGERIVIVPKIKKRFDVAIMNPPYQPTVNSTGGGTKSHGNVIWPRFVELALGITAENGFIAAVHPVAWRKPLSDLFPVMTSRNILYLETHTKKDGIKTFGASTPLDWYILQNSPANGKTTVVRDVNGEIQKIDLREFSFLPNCDFKFIQSLIAGPNDEKCEVLYSRSIYGSDKPWMNEEKKGKFKYPCVHSTPTNGDPRLWFSSKREEFFGVSKVIFGDSDTITSVIIDMDGKYGITDHGIGAAVSSRTEADGLKRALESSKFNDVLKACRWSQFQIDWRLFTLFRADFWKEFI